MQLYRHTFPLPLVYAVRLRYSTSVVHVYSAQKTLFVHAYHGQQMALRNVEREVTRAGGYDSWRLKGPDGVYIEAFDRFAHHVRDEKFATRKRDCEVVSRFIDYLYEVGVLGAAPVTRTQVNDAIDY